MDNYPWDVGRSDAERAFLRQLEQLCIDNWPFDAWTHYPQLVVTLAVTDPEHNAILRTLRIDFDGQSLAGGNDPSGQIDPKLNPEDPDYFELDDRLTPPQFAERALDWFHHEASRPIDRQEWDGTDDGWLLWVLADEEERPLVAQYHNRPDRPPDRVVRLSPPNIRGGACEILRAVVRGERPLDALTGVGVRLTFGDGGFRAEVPEWLGTEIPLADLARGLLSTSARGPELRKWAFTVLALDADFDEIDSTDGAALLDALWSASAGQAVSEQSLEVARQLAR